MRRSAALLLLALVFPAAACGGDDDASSSAADETTTTEDAGSEEESEEDETTTTEDEEDDDDGADGSADAYAGDVCGSIGAWYDEIEMASTALVEDAGAIAEDPAAGKQLVLDFLDDAIGFTDTLITDLEDAGVPDTESGEQTATELVSGIEDVRELFQGARDDTEALPADDPQALGTGLQDIGTALQESATAVGANFEEVLTSVDDPELAAAFEESTACRDLATLS